MTKKQRVLEYLKYHPTATKAEVAQVLGVSGKTVQRARRDLQMADEVPHILLLDIETLPIRGYFWECGKQYIGPDNIIDDWCIVSWAAKWLFDDEVMSEVLGGQEAQEHNDWRIVEDIWMLVDEADILIAHNGDYFDFKKLNARFILNDLIPPMCYQTIDTVKVSRKHFAFSSNKLNWLSKMFFNKEKIKTDFDLWKECDRGGEKALKQMQDYNKRDVVLLEEVYLELRGWIKSHPNMGLYVEGEGERCGNCGGVELDWRGYYRTPAGRFKAFRCGGCNAIGRSRFSDLTKDEKRNLTISVAR